MKRIPLSRGLFALVDDDDYERVSQFTWYAVPKEHQFYACNGGKAGGDGRAKSRKRIYLHQFILGAKWVDHKNGDPLDCRKENLRSATMLQNSFNRCQKRSSKAPYKGIHLRKKDGKWVANCGPNGPGRKWLGSFNTPLEAAFAYDRTAREMYGEFARPNFGEGELL